MRSFSKRPSSGQTALAILQVTLLAACASAPAPQPDILTNIDPFEQDAINALKLDLEQAAHTGLNTALVRYQKLDDLEGQWRIHLTKTKLANGKGDQAAASVEVDNLKELADLIDTNFVHYHTYILLGQIREEKHYYQSALAVASTKLQQAVALTYLDRIGEAIALVDPRKTDHPTDRAFVLFRHGVSTGNRADLQRALSAYKLAGDSRGVADTLVLLSRLSMDQNDPEMAVIYGRRAIRVLTAMGDLDRADVVQAWLAQ
jgi:hypothetical protein